MCQCETSTRVLWFSVKVCRVSVFQISPCTFHSRTSHRRRQTTRTHTPQSHVHRGGGSEPDQRAHTTMRDRARDTAGDHDDVDAHEHLCDGGVGVGELAHVDDEERGGDDPVGVASPADGL